MGSLTAHRAKNHDCLLRFSSKLDIYLIQYQMKTTLVITRSLQICMARTQQEFKPSKHTSNRNHTIPFNLLKQHALNTNITLECTECGKHRVVYSQKKASPRLCKKFKSVFSELFFTCGAKIQELDCNEYSMLYVRDNFTCISPVKTLYYSAGHPPCCCHCGTKHHLINENNHYLICSICKNVHKKQAVMKRKQKFVSA